MNEAELKEEFEREIEIANKDIDLMPEQEDYMRGYLGGILCAYRIVFGKNYEEKNRMTTEEAIEELKYWLRTTDETSHTHRAILMAISALQEKESEEEE